MRPLSRAILLANALAALALPAHPQADQSGPPGLLPLPAGMQQSFLYDPYLGMNAFVVRYPKGWHMQGVVHQGNPCRAVPVQVFRVTSPDGLMMIERMPPLAWSWGTGPNSVRPKRGCLPLDDGLSAKEFLKLLSAELKVEYVSDEPVPQEILDSFKRNSEATDEYWTEKYEGAGMRPPENYHEMAWANVRFKNGSYQMVGRLQAVLTCDRGWGSNWKHQTWWTARCDAAVRYEYAPEARFKEVDNWAKTTGAAELPAFVAAWKNALDRRQREVLNAIDQTAAANMAAQNNAFQQTMAAQQQQHEQFMATMQSGTDASMANAARISATNHTMASDWVDYALGQQTVRDPTTGETAKVQSGYNYTWRNSAGNQAYQTPDPNANPNGTLPGTWTQQLTVHGDGTPP